jgi:hypothetical protein
MDSSTNPLNSVMLCGLSVLLEFIMVLRLTPGHTCDVISVVTEFMVDGAEVDARPHVRSNSITLNSATHC